MKKLLLFLLPLSLILSSCSSVDPIEYNDQLVKYIDKAGQRVTNLNTEINDLFESEEYTKLQEYTKATTDSLRTDIKDIKNLKKPDGADGFQNAVIAYIEALIVNTEIMGAQYSKVTAEMSEEEFDEINKLVLESEEVYNNKFEEMATAQKGFAKEKNFDLTYTKQ
ncbi:MAG: hypothetical protein E6772_14485 [Dysgonomonas sp.]|nr:hypothetical protein [Dysgonomonas sp.]